MMPFGRFGLFTVLIITTCALGCDQTYHPGSSSSSSGGGGSGGDSGPGAARCDPTKPFGPVAPVAELPSGNFVNTPWLSADELTILFAHLVPGQAYNLFMATRPSRDAAFEAPQPLSSVNTSDQEYDASMLSDGLSLYYVRGGYQAYLSRRASTSDAFDLGDPLSVGPPATNVRMPRMSKNKLYFYYMGWFEGADPKLYVDVAPTWEQSLALEHSDPVHGFSISADDKTLYFSAAPSGGGFVTVYRATRADVLLAFKQATPVTELNDASITPKGVTVSWVSDDECVLYGVAVMASSADPYIVRAVRGN